jgi:myosin heavy chain 6/7
VADWKVKADSLTQELEHSQRDCRAAATELFRVRNGHAECLSTLDEVKRENKVLSDDIRDIMDQISEGGRSIHEIEKVSGVERGIWLVWKRKGWGGGTSYVYSLLISGM